MATVNPIHMGHSHGDTLHLYENYQDALDLHSQYQISNQNNHFKTFMDSFSFVYPFLIFTTLNCISI